MLKEKLEKFALLLESDQIENLYESDMGCIGNLRNSKVTVIDGRKYIKVNVGGSGKYMIDKETEEIYGIKAYGVIHKGYKFGTLDTINNYFWGRYRAVKLNYTREIDHILTVDREIAYKEQEKKEMMSSSNKVISLTEYKRAKAI